MRKSKTSDTERLDSATIERVLSLLEPKDGSKPGTKKDACAILGITYNTSRLTSILEKYKEEKERTAQRRAEKRGKPATESEVSYVVTSYLEGESIEAISGALYRGNTFVKSILEKYGVPLRQSAHSYWTPELVPEPAMRDRFIVGEKVYSMRYDSLAEIKAEVRPGVYRIWLISDRWSQFAYQPSEELASLDHIRKLGISV